MEELQRKVEDFCKEYGESPPEHRVLDTLSELGEVAKEVLLMSDYGRKPLEETRKEELELELGDLLYSLITLANYFEIDLKKALEKVLRKYEKRLEQD